MCPSEHLLKYFYSFWCTNLLLHPGSLNFSNMQQSARKDAIAINNRTTRFSCAGTVGIHPSIHTCHLLWWDTACLYSTPPRHLLSVLFASPSMAVCLSIPWRRVNKLVTLKTSCKTNLSTRNKWQSVGVFWPIWVSSLKRSLLPRIWLVGIVIRVDVC